MPPRNAFVPDSVGDLPLFARPVPAPVAAARDRAVASVERNAGDDFTAAACKFVLAHLRAHGDASSEQLTDACKAAGIVPHDDRAFGAVYAKLARARAVVRVGTSIRHKGHGSIGGSLWRVAP
jgi:hypothetical protein